MELYWVGWVNTFQPDCNNFWRLGVDFVHSSSFYLQSSYEIDKDIFSLGCS